MLRLKRKDMFFFVAYIVYFGGLIIDLTAIKSASLIKSSCSATAIICLAINFLSGHFFGKNMKKSGFVPFSILAAMLFLSVLTKDFFILTMLLFGMNLADLDDRGIEQLFYLSQRIFLFLSILIILACVFGIIPNVNTARSYGLSERWAYGFEHSQILSLIMLYVVFYYYICKKKITFINVFIVQLLAFGIAYKFDTRNAFYSIEIFYMIIFLWELGECWNQNVGEFFKALFYKLSVLSAGIMAVISLIFLKLYEQGSTIAILLDSFFTGRIRLALKTFQTVPIKMIRVITFAEYRALLVSTMDNGYYYFVIRYGLLYMLLFVILIGIVGRYFKKRDNMFGCAAIIAISISCAVANTIMGCYFFPFWMIAMREIQHMIWKKPYNQMVGGRC